MEDKFLEEIYSSFRGNPDILRSLDEKEGDLRAFYTYGKFYSLATASAMAASIHPILNIPAYILTPTIALMLHSMLKIGRNAYCKMVKL